LLHRDNEDLAVADLAGLGRAHDRLDRLAGHVVRHGDLDLHLGQEVDGVLAAAVDLGVALLPAEALHLGDGHALDARLGERFLHLLQLERLDDGDDEFHGVRLLGVRQAISTRCAKGNRAAYSGRTVRICNSLSCRSVTGVGLAVIRSWPFWVLGKAITSRMLVVPQSRATIRSRPKAMPPCGGAPKVKALSM